jgi:hypothetical protein
VELSSGRRRIIRISQNEGRAISLVIKGMDQRAGPPMCLKGEHRLRLGAPEESSLMFQGKPLENALPYRAPRIHRTKEKTRARRAQPRHTIETKESTTQRRAPRGSAISAST